MADRSPSREDISNSTPSTKGSKRSAVGAAVSKLTITALKEYRLSDEESQDENPRAAGSGAGKRKKFKNGLVRCRQLKWNFRVAVTLV